MTRHVAQIASMLEMINAYGGIEAAKENFLTMSELTADAEKAQASWTNSLKEFYHTLDAGKKFFMSFVDGPGHIMIESMNTILGLFVKIDDIANKVGGSALSTAFSTFIGVGGLGIAGNNLISTVLQNMDAKKEANQILSAIMKTVKEIDPKGEKNLDISKVLDNLQHITIEADNAAGAFGNLRKSVQNFKSDKTLTNFSKIFINPLKSLITNINWVGLGITAAITGAMYLYRKHEEEMYNYAEAIKDANATLLEYNRIQNTLSIEDKTERMIYSQIDAWSSYKSAIDEAGASLRDTLAKLSDIKPIKNKFNEVINPVTGLSELRETSIKDLIKNNPDFVNNIYEIFGKEIQKVPRDKQTINKYQNLGMDETQYAAYNFLLNGGVRTLLNKKDVLNRNLDWLRDINTIASEPLSYKKLLGDKSNLLARAFINDDEKIFSNLDEKEYAKIYKSFTNMRAISNKLGLNRDERIAVMNNYMQTDGPYGSLQQKFIQFEGKNINFADINGLTKLINQTEIAVKSITNLLDKEYELQNEYFKSWADYISAVNSRIKFWQSENSKDVIEIMAELNRTGITGLINNYGLNPDVSYIASDTYEKYKKVMVEMGLDSNNIDFKDTDFLETIGKFREASKETETYNKGFLQKISSNTKYEGIIKLIKDEFKKLEIENPTSSEISDQFLLKIGYNNAEQARTEISKYSENEKKLNKEVPNVIMALTRLGKSNDIEGEISTIKNNSGINFTLSDLNLNNKDLKKISKYKDDIFKNLPITEDQLISYYTNSNLDDKIKGQISQYMKNEPEIDLMFSKLFNNISKAVRKTAISNSISNKDMIDIIVNNPGAIVDYINAQEARTAKNLSVSKARKQQDESKKDTETEAKEREKSMDLLNVETEYFRKKQPFLFNNSDYSKFVLSSLENEERIEKLDIEYEALSSQMKKLDTASNDYFEKKDLLEIEMRKNALEKLNTYQQEIKNTLEFIQKNTDIIRKNSEIRYNEEQYGIQLSKTAFGDVSPVYYELSEVFSKLRYAYETKNIIQNEMKMYKNLDQLDSDKIVKYTEELNKNEEEIFNLRIKLLEKEKEMIENGISDITNIMLAKMKGEYIQMDESRAVDKFNKGITALIMGDRIKNVEKPELTKLDKQIGIAEQSKEHLESIKISIDQVLSKLKELTPNKDIDGIDGNSKQKKQEISKISTPEEYEQLKIIENAISKKGGNKYENIAKYLMYKKLETPDSTNSTTGIDKYVNLEDKVNSLNEENISQALNAKYTQEQEVDITKFSKTIETILEKPNIQQSQIKVDKTEEYYTNKKTDTKIDNAISENNKEINSEFSDVVSKMLSITDILNSISVFWQTKQNEEYEERVASLKKQYDDENRRAQYDINLSSTNAEKTEKEMELSVNKLKQQYNLEVMEEENKIDNEVMAFHQSFVDKASEMIQYLSSINENIGGKSLGIGGNSQGTNILSSAVNAVSGFLGFGTSSSNNIANKSSNNIVVAGNTSSTVIPNYSKNIVGSTGSINGINENIGNVFVDSNGNISVLQQGTGNIENQKTALSTPSGMIYIQDTNTQVKMNALNTAESALTDLQGDAGDVSNGVGKTASLLMDEKFQKMTGINVGTANAIGGTLGAISGGFNIGQMLASGNFDPATLVSTGMGLYSSAAALGSLGSSSIVGSIGSAFGLGASGATAGLAAGALTAGMIALPAIALGSIAYNNAKDKAKYRAAQRYNEELARLQEEQLQKQLEALKNERIGLTQSVANQNLNVGQTEALRRAVMNANLSATSTESYKDYQVSYRRGLFGRRRTTWVMGNATATANLSDFGYSTISSIEDTYGLMDSITEKMKELQDYLDSRHADSGDVEMRKDWAENKAMLEASEMLYNQIKDLQESIIRSSTSLNQNFFGFEQIGLNEEGGKAQEGEDIYKYEIGAWEERSNLLNTFVTDFMEAGNSVGENIANIFITGVTNSFVKNNSILNEAINELENAFKEIGKVYLNPDQLVNAAEYELSSGKNTVSVYEDVLKQLKDAGFGNEELFEQAESLLEDKNWEELVKVIQEISASGNNKDEQIKDLINSIDELEKIQNDLENQMREFIDDWLEGGGNLSDIVGSMDNILSRTANILTDLAISGDSETAFSSLKTMIDEKILPEINDSIMDNLTENILDIEGDTNDLKNSLISGNLNSGYTSDYIDKIGNTFDILENPLKDIDQSIGILGEDGLQKILAYKNIVDEINEALYERMTIDEKISYNQDKLNEEASKYKTQIVEQGGVINIGILGDISFKELEKQLQDLLAKGEEIPEELKNAIEQANGQYGTLNQVIKDLEKDMKDAEFATREFTSAWFDGLIEGDYDTIRSELSEETQGMMDEIMSGFYSEDWESSGTSIGTNMANSILDSYAEVLLNSSEIKNMAANLNQILYDNLNFVEDNGVLNFDMLYELSQQTQKLAIEAETNRQRFEAVQGMFDYTQDIRYSSLEKEIDYQTSSTREAIYNINNNNTFQIGNLVASSNDLTMFANALAPYLMEAFKNYGR